MSLSNTASKIEAFQSIPITFSFSETISKLERRNLKIFKVFVNFDIDWDIAFA